jgi:4-amino-4-deoxy-L-arabinose transferase-like glycosyltransferase
MSPRDRVLRIFIFPFVVAFAIVSWHTSKLPLVEPVADETAYLSISRALNRTGVFTDGRMSTTLEENKPGRFFTPAYPIFVSIVSRLNAGLQTSIECYGRGGTRCGGSLQGLVVSQAVLATMTSFFIFLIAWRLSNSEAVGWLTMFAALATGEFSYWATRYLTETLAFTTLFAFLYFAVLSYLDQSRPAVFLAGLALGLATLTRPTYVYLYYFMVAMLPLAFYCSGRIRLRNVLLFGILFIAGYAALILPWALRNIYYFGDVALTKGYAELSLVQRLGYNILSWKEIGVAAIAWLPSIGQPLAKLLFAPGLYQRLGTSTYSDFEPLYVYKGELFERTLAAAGGSDKHLNYLIWTYILGDLPKHLAVTVLLTVRGMWVGRYLAFAGMTCLFPAATILYSRGRLMPFLLFLLSLLFLSFLSGFVSTSILRYHVPMIAAYAFAVSLVVVLGGQRLITAASRSLKASVGDSGPAPVGLSRDGTRGSASYPTPSDRRNPLTERRAQARRE